jgi:hypothetical protein
MHIHSTMWRWHDWCTFIEQCDVDMIDPYSMNVDQSCQSHIVLWMWISHVNVTLFYEYGSIMSTSHCSMNVDQSYQRHIVLWMWINHVNVTIFYECGSIMSTSHSSMNVDQSCKRHIVQWMCITYYNKFNCFLMWRHNDVSFATFPNSRYTFHRRYVLLEMVFSSHLTSQTSPSMWRWHDWCTFIEQCDVDMIDPHS